MKELLRTADLSQADLRKLLILARHAAAEPLRWPGILAGRTVVLYFAEPDPAIVADAQKLAADSGAVLQVGHDPIAAVGDASAVYTDVWLSMGDAPDTRAARMAALAPAAGGQAAIGAIVDAPALVDGAAGTLLTAAALHVG